MKGRVHFYEGLRLDEVVFPSACSGASGEDLVLTNAAGAINSAFAPGDLMVIEDHLDLLGNRSSVRTRRPSGRASPT